MRYVVLVFFALIGGIANAEAPPKPESWQPVTPIIGCKVDTETDMGACRLFMDTISTVFYLVFWDKPNSIKWIRYKNADGEYVYTYTRPLPGNTI